MSINAENFKVTNEESVNLKVFEPDWLPKWVKKQLKTGGKKAAKAQVLEILEENRKELINMQELLWASSTYSLLIVLQGMDSAGKDGTIRHVMSGVNPQGCQISSFRTPTEEELNHDFLWRYVKALPERGRIGIFNRSYYEDVLIVKVRPEVFQKQKLPIVDEGKLFWDKRYEDINLFERHLVRNGTIVLKFFLNISFDEQKKRLLKRLEDPEKQWKFSVSDLSERSKWPQYMQAYEEMLSKTSTEWAPWYVIPANKKWVAHSSISSIVISEIAKLNLKYPVLTKEQETAFEKAKAELEKQ